MESCNETRNSYSKRRRHEPTGGVNLPSPILENPTLPRIKLENPPENLEDDDKITE